MLHKILIISHKREEKHEKKWYLRMPKSVVAHAAASKTAASRDEPK